MNISDFSDYDRKMILLRNDVALIMHLFYRKGRDNLESAFLEDNEKYLDASYNVYKDAAHQFMLQLEGNTCIEFLEELKKEIERKLEESYKLKETYEKS